MNKKKLLSLILAIAFVISLCSINAFAEPAEVTAADIYIAAQLSGGFLAPPETVQVSSDLSEKYGFSDEVDGISVLDAALREHEIIFGDAFTPETAGDYIAVSYGSPTKVFGVDNSEYYGGFLVNGGYPNDGTESGYGGYTGTTYATQKLIAGDKVDFFFYEDENYGDTYTWIDGDLSALPGEDAEVTVTGAFAMYGYMYKTPEDFKNAASPVEDAAFAWVGENGELTEIENVYTDEDGNATISIPSDMEPGTYYLTVMADGDDYTFLCIMNPTPFIVANELTAYVSISQNADFVKTKDNEILNRLPVTISDKAEYTIDDVLLAAHEEYADSEHGYSSGEGYYGLSIFKLWGDESGAFGYWQNDNSAWSLTDKVSDGDFISAFVYKDAAGYSDAYTKFESGTYSTSAGAETEFTLLKYDWGTYSFIPCEGASVSVSELTDTDAVTGENGKATLIFPAEGTYTVVAKNADAPIVPSSCTVTVSAPIAVTGLTLEESVSVYENGKAKINYSVEPDNAFDKTVSWVSSDESIATVSDGVVKGIKAGDAEITATTNDGGFSKKCAVTVKEVPAELSVLHAIAAKYKESGIANDNNAPWFAADLAAYKYLFPDTENYLSDEQIQEYLDVLIPAADAAERAGDLSKYIIALRALGFDPTDVVTSDFKHVNIVEKLENLISENDAGVTNIYTLPYVIIAMNEDKAYLSGDDMDKLISSALEQKAAWQDNTWGIDAAAAMAVALAPFSDNEDVKAVLDETAELIKAAQADDGSLGNASSTGLALAALSSAGIDGTEVKKESGASVIDGLLTQTNENLDGFVPTSNSFATEQGMRGLLAHQLLLQGTDKALYDFSDNPQNTAQASWANNCPVTFNVIPDTAAVTVEGADAVSENKYDLAAGEYSYSVSKSGYTTANKTFTVTEEEAASHTPKTVNVSLSSKPSSGGNSSTISVTVKVLTHDKTKCGGAYTYKKNASDYTTLASGTMTLSKGQTAFDALHLLLTENNIDYIEKTYGYISSIGDDAEFDHGPNSGWLFQVDGKSGAKGSRDTVLSKNCTVTWFYTDDYSEEAGSEGWKKSSSGGGTTLSSACKVTFETNGGEKYPVLEVEKDGKMSYVADPERQGYIFEGWFTDKELTKAFDINEPITNNITLYAKWSKDPDYKEASIYNDVSKTDWFHDAAVYCYEHGLMIGTGDNFEPGTEMTRAMLVTVLYRLDGNYEKATECKFKDVSENDWYFDSVAWGEANGIILGISDSEFAPNEKVTREQTALILSRYAKFKDCFTENYSDLSGFEDANEISDWAKDAVKWAVGEGIITGMTDTLISPKTTLTRAQAATLLMRFFKLLNK